MKRNYEFAVVLRMDPNVQAMEDTVQQINGWIEADGYGTVKRVDRWGQRRLAYEIDRQRDGYYVFFYADMDPAGLPELEDNMRLANAVLRYLVVRQDEKPAKPAATPPSAAAPTATTPPPVAEPATATAEAPSEPVATTEAPAEPATPETPADA